MSQAQGILKAIAFTIALGLTTAGPIARYALAAEPLTDATVVQAIASAKTPEDHKAIAAYFREQGKQEGDKVARHQDMMKSSESMRGKPLEFWRTHCRQIIAEAHKMQENFEALASEHDKLAQAAAH